MSSDLVPDIGEQRVGQGGDVRVWVCRERDQRPPDAAEDGRVPQCGSRARAVRGAGQAAQRRAGAHAPQTLSRTLSAQLHWGKDTMGRQGKK